MHNSNKNSNKLFNKLVTYIALGSMIGMLFVCTAPYMLGGGIQSGFPIITRIGNTSQYNSSTGAFTSGHCVSTDASHNLVDNGSACGSGGSGTVAAGTINSVGYYAATGTTISGDTNFTDDGAGNITVTSCTGCGGGGGLSIVSPFLFDGSNYWLGWPLRQITKPDLTSFSWVNQSGASVTADGHAIILHVPFNSFVQHERIVSIGGNTTVTAAISVTQLPVNFTECGVGLYESGSGKWEGIGTMAQNSTGYSIQGRRWTNPTTFSTGVSNGTQVSGQNGYGAPNVIWIQAIYDGTNVTYNYSNDGISFLQMLQETKATFFTTAPDNFSFYCAAGNSTATYDAYMEVLSWKMN
jgi:hypothetical protein